MTAPAELVIEVTADDIAKGVVGDACRCPIALAVSRLLGIEAAEGNLAVMDRMVKVHYEDYRWRDRYRLPTEAEDFIEDFDCRDEVQPLTFTARLIGGQS
jgi:hypothetical protein